MKESLMTKVSVKNARAEWERASLRGCVGRSRKNEADEWRVVYDATHGIPMKNRVSVLDEIRFQLGFGGVLGRDGWRRDRYALLGYLRRLEGPSTDSHSAYRMGLLASRADNSEGALRADDDVLYVNTVSTVGVSSAGYWRLRLAALLLRVIHVLLGALHPAHMLLVSDDGCITRVGPAFHKNDFVGVPDPGDLLSCTFVEEG